MGIIGGRVHRRTLLLQAGRLAVGLTILVTGCGGDRPPPTVGQRVVRNGLAMTVEKVQRHRLIQVGDIISSPGEDRTFLVVHLTLGNVAHDRIAYRGEEFRLLDANGRAYALKQSIMGQIPTIPNGSIERGGQSRVLGTFAVPIGASGVVLHYRPSVGGEFRVALPSPAQIEETPSVTAPPPPGWPYTATPTPSPNRAVPPTIPPTPTHVLGPSPSPAR